VSKVICDVHCGGGEARKSVRDVEVHLSRKRLDGNIKVAREPDLFTKNFVELIDLRSVALENL